MIRVTKTDSHPGPLPEGEGANRAKPHPPDHPVLACSSEAIAARRRNPPLTSDKPCGQTPPHLTDRSRSLRRVSTYPERAVWSLVRNRQLNGLCFRRQQAIGPYIVDFYCSAARLVVEIDGESHDGREEEDAKRMRYLKRRGLRLLRLTNDEVVSDREAVADAILAAACER